jgi:nucleotide-binding universal stress UspA family protein
LFRNILIPTDGSDLAAKAVEQGVHFAKEIGAKITAMTVTEPFELVSVSQIQLEYTPIEYKKHAEAQADKVLGVVSAAAKSAGVVCAARRARSDLSGDHRSRRGEKVRFDRDGLTWASRCLGGRPRQRDGQSAHALEDPGARVSVRRIG